MISYRVLAAAAFLLLTGCHRIEAPASVIRVADPAAASQLLSGFYKVESGAWRWTGGEFSVSLAPPPGSAVHGARLNLRLYLPDAQIRAIGPMTLRAEVDGHRLEPETFSKGGSYDYSRAVPACILDTNIVPVNFSFDNYALPTETEGRELGAVVTIAGLLPE